MAAEPSNVALRMPASTSFQSTITVVASIPARASAVSTSSRATWVPWGLSVKGGHESEARRRSGRSPAIASAGSISSHSATRKACRHARVRCSGSGVRGRVGCMCRFPPASRATPFICVGGRCFICSNLENAAANSRAISGAYVRVTVARRRPNDSRVASRTRVDPTGRSSGWLSP